MKQLSTIGIVLNRVDFGEADRILTVLTPDRGKLHLMAKGVRKIKSKLAGGIELFSVSNITFIEGKKDMGTLISARLLDHYGHIIISITRVQLGYELIKLLNKITEDYSGREYFELLEQTFQALNEPMISEELIRCWFLAQLLHLEGRRPNLQTDYQGKQLAINGRYNFNLEDMSLKPQAGAPLTAKHIKFLRLLFGHHQPKTLQQIEGHEELLKPTLPIIQTMLNTVV